MIPGPSFGFRNHLAKTLGVLRTQVALFTNVIDDIIEFPTSTVSAADLPLIAASANIAREKLEASPGIAILDFVRRS